MSEFTGKLMIGLLEREMMSNPVKNRKNNEEADFFIHPNNKTYRTIESCGAVLKFACNIN